MSISKILSQDLAHEAAIARRMLEIVPEQHLGWRPVENAMTLGRLAGHVAQTLHWIEPIMTRDDWDMDHQPLYTPAEPTSVRDLLVEFGAGVGDFHRFMQGARDEELQAPWTLRRNGAEITTMTRARAIQRYIFSHLSHHCGQLSVYLWSLDLPVPTIYRPTEDHRDHTVEESEYDREPLVMEEVAAAV